MAAPVEQQLQTLRDISQNFPLMASSLVKQAVDSSMKKEIQKNQKV